MPNLNTCSFDGCDRGRYRRDELCSAHYAQRRTGKGLKPIRVRLPREQVLQQSIDKTDGCWNWTAILDRHGYGVFWTGENRQLAHRYVWEQTHGPIAPGIDLDHICHNPACVNPAHLRAITHRQNLQHRKGPNSNNSSGYLGVSWHAGDRKWRARVKHEAKTYFVGNFDTAEEAGEDARLKRLELYTHNDRDRI